MKKLKNALNLFSLILLSGVLSACGGLDKSSDSAQLDASKTVRGRTGSETGIDTRDRYGNTALIEAAQKNNRERAKLLIESGADINAQNDRGETALIEAAKKHHVDMVKLLVDHQAKLNIQDSRGDTALTRAIRAHSPNTKREGINELMNLLIRGNISVEEANKNLGIAAERSHLIALERLLEVKGIDVNTRDSRGRTALVTAILRWSPSSRLRRNPRTLAAMETIKKLLTKKADVTVPDDQGLTALMHAVPKGGYHAWAASPEKLALIKLLLEKSPSGLELRDKNGETALMKAQHGTVFELLVKAGANPNAQDNKGETLLMKIAHNPWYRYRNQTIAITKALIKAKGNINLQNKEGETALSLLIRRPGRKNTMEMVNLLVESKANLDIQNSKGETVLMAAIDRDRTEIVKLFIQAGANVNKQDSNGKTALKRAIEKGGFRIEIIKLLRDAGAKES